MGTRQVINEAKNLQRQEDLLRQPIRATVKNSIPERESAYVNMALEANTSELMLRHPFFSINSWIRVMPEVGTTVATQVRGDSPVTAIAGYLVEPDDAVRRIKNFKKGIGTFRILKEGEIEIMSKGRSYAHFSSSGDLELMGGTIRHDLLQTELETKSQSPTFKRTLHLYNAATLAHEERFGVVKRPDTQRPNAFQKFIRNSDNKFAQEYGRWLNSADGTELVYLHEGELYDNAGKEKKQNSTNKALRYERFVKHRSTGDLTIQIDEELNISYLNSSKAKETKFVLGTKNTLDLSGETVKGAFTKSGNLSFNTAFTLRSAKIRLNSVDVGMGPNPIIPILLGTPMLTGVIAPILAALTPFFTVLASDPVINTAYPQISGAAKQTLPQLAAAVAGQANAVSTQVKVSG